MLAAVSFDDDTFFEADKISNESANLFLTPKFYPTKLLGSQVFPQ